jgi:hypothetical protein
MKRSAKWALSVLIGVVFSCFTIALVLVWLVFSPTPIERAKLPSQAQKELSFDQFIPKDGTAQRPEEPLEYSSSSTFSK